MFVKRLIKFDKGEVWDTIKQTKYESNNCLIPPDVHVPDFIEQLFHVKKKGRRF